MSSLCHLYVISIVVVVVCVWWELVCHLANSHPSIQPTVRQTDKVRYRDAFASENDGEVEGHARKDPEPVDIGETRTVEKNISDGKEI